MRIMNVVGARPNFMKIAPLMEEYGRHPDIEPMLVHTGQRYDEKMSTLFFKQLGIREPDVNLDFLKLQSSARVVFTDSGGIQEETIALKIPCITLRENTERPVTVEMGTNQIVGTDTQKIVHAFKAIMDGNFRESRIPPLWDGKAAERIVDVIEERISDPKVRRQEVIKMN